MIANKGPLDTPALYLKYTSRTHDSTCLSCHSASYYVPVMWHLVRVFDGVWSWDVISYPYVYWSIVLVHDSSFLCFLEHVLRRAISYLYLLEHVHGMCFLGGGAMLKLFLNLLVSCLNLPLSQMSPHSILKLCVLQYTLSLSMINCSEVHNRHKHKHILFRLLKYYQ